MEQALRLAVAAIIILIIVVVVVMLINQWGGQSTGAIDGIFKFFENVLGGKASLPAASTPIKP
jgi:hypothetical protein